jgi:short-subunit dehydrogenase
MEITSRYALITGASSGIGRKISEELAIMGYNIIAVSNEPVQLEELKQEIKKICNKEVITINIDLSRQNAANEIFELCVKQNIIVDVLINNAGIFVFSELIKTHIDKMSSMLSLHIETPVLLCRLFGEQMKIRRSGFILNISSITSRMPYPGISLYGSTKAFMRHFTRALRTELKLYGVRVTCLIPGAVSTQLYGTDKYNTPLLRTTGLMKTPGSVAKAGIRALFNNKPECIPGMLNKIIFFLVPLVHHSIIYLIYSRSKLFRQ